MPTIEYKVTADTAQFDSSIKASQGSLKAATKAAAALVAGVVALGAAYISLVEDIVATTDEINTLSRATGLSRESINGLRLAAIASGKSLKDIVPKNLAKNMLAARDGSNDARHARLSAAPRRTRGSSASASSRPFNPWRTRWGLTGSSDMPGDHSTRCPPSHEAAFSWRCCPMAEVSAGARDLSPSRARVY